MSVESAKAFIEKVKTDEAFRKQIIEAGENRPKMVVDAGFKFSEQEYKEAVDEVGEPVSDEDLDGVAGGWCLLHGCKIHMF